MPAEGDFFARIRAQDHGDDFQLPAGAGIHLVLVELEIQRQGVTTGGVFHQRRVVKIPAGHAAGVVGEQLVQVDFRDDPVRRCGRLLERHRELGALLPIAGFHVGKIADGVFPLEHRAQRLAFAEPVFALFKQDAKPGDLLVRHRLGVHKSPRELEILLEHRLQKTHPPRRGNRRRRLWESARRRAAAG